MSAPAGGADPRSTRTARVLVATAAVCCLATGVLVGWALWGGEPRPPTYLEQLTRELALRPEQVAALETVLSEEDHDIDELLKQQLKLLSEPVAERRVRTEAALLAALDDQQRQRYEQLTQAYADGARDSSADGARR